MRVLVCLLCVFGWLAIGRATRSRVHCSYGRLCGWKGYPLKQPQPSIPYVTSATALTRDVTSIADMHTYARPAGSRTDRAFIRRYIAPIPGAWCDRGRNWHVVIGEAPTVLWSCHTDTVARQGGRQRVYVDRAGILSLHLLERRNCLGADDTAGVWLACEMIARGVAGHYVFHYAEEIGGIGSRALAQYEPELLDGITIAIALDRAHTGDVITHQMGGRTASEAFAASMGHELARVAPRLTYGAADGIYTDTAEYAEIVPECSNLSVGYERAHSADETLDTRHLIALRDALCAIDVTALTVDRDPQVFVYEPAPVRQDTWRSWADTWDDTTAVATLPSSRYRDCTFDTVADDDYWDRKFAALERTCRAERKGRS